MGEKAMSDPTTARTGDTIWMLNTWMRFAATGADTNGQFAVLEQRCTPAGDPPRHVHTHEDEAFYVLEGRLTATIEDQPPISAGPGECVFLPRGRAHGLHAETPEVRGLVILTPAGFDQFFAAVGEPAGAEELPQPSAPDVPLLVGTAARYGVTILPPN
jgi:quercetin dioxygenase-like cupin family protein